MGQEFFINDQNLENKVRELLPSQGGAGAGFDLSASTQIIPIIDLTESAQGSNLRQDLQSALSFDSVTAYNVVNTTNNVLTDTGYWRFYGNVSQTSNDIGGTPSSGIFRLNDAAGAKVIAEYGAPYADSDLDFSNTPYDFIVFLEAGDFVSLQSSGAATRIIGCFRQIAAIDGTLRNP